MKIKVTLENAPNCELASEVIENPKATDADDMSEQIQDIIGGWTLSAGDTITIREL